MKPASATKLLPSAITGKAAPEVASILSRYSQNSRQQDDDAFCQYFRGIPSKEPSSTMDAQEARARSLITAREMSEWQTPYMPLLTSRQLELTLLEIRQRQKHYRRKNAIQSSDALDASANKPKTKKEAAIFVPLCTVNNVPSVLFMRRSGSLSTHASQISFPGGYFDKSDISNNNATYFNILGNAENRLVNTAVREMQEELCFDLDDIEKRTSSQQLGNNLQHLPFLSILGQTQPVPSMTGNKVTPIIGQINYDLPHFSTEEFKHLFPGNSDELDWIFTIPIEQLLAEETSEPLKKWGDQDLANIKGKFEYWGPVFPVPNVEEKRAGDRIWGLTASVLRPLLHRIFKPVFIDDRVTSKF